jgi:hypothetical protein
VSDRARRIGMNEALYRAVNERIEGLNDAFGLVTETIAVVCECGNLECSAQIEIGMPAYERIRSDPTFFVVLPGHAIEDVEEVIERQDAYDVVRKHPGEPEQVARETDTRT